MPSKITSVDQKLKLSGIKKVEKKFLTGANGSNMRSMMTESRISKQSYLTTGSYAVRNEAGPQKQRPQKAKIYDLGPRAEEQKRDQKKLSKHVVANSYGVDKHGPSKLNAFNPFLEPKNSAPHVSTERQALVVSQKH